MHRPTDQFSCLRYAASILAIGFSSTVTVAAGVAQENERPMSVEDILAIETLGQVAMSPDGRWVAYVVTTRDFEGDANRTHIWVVSADGGNPYRLTSNGGDASPVWHPSGEWLAFTSDRGDSRQIHGIRPDGGEAWQVTRHPTAVGAFAFSPDGNKLAFAASPEPTDEDRELEKIRGLPIVWDSSYTDEWMRLYSARLDVSRVGESVEQRSPDSLHVQGFVWSPDSRAIAFGARPSPVLRTFRDGDTWLSDSVGAAARRVTSMDGGDNPVAWTETTGLIVSGSGREFGTYNNQLWTIPLAADGSIVDPVSLTSGLDENASYVAATSHALMVSASYRTGTRLYRIPLRDGAAVGPPALMTDDARYYSRASSNRDATVVAFLAETGSAPPNVYVSSTESWTPIRLSSHNASIDRMALGEQRVVTWQSRADGEEIEGVLTLPVGYRADERVPLVLVIHGGPSGVSADRFNATRGAYPIQVYAGMGIAVLQPNYRGSTGYGERFRGLNRGDISGKDWVDIDSGVDAMIARGMADPNRLAVSGWSFGGHHTYWGITQTDRFKAASAGAGANDLISMYSQTDIPEFYHTYLGPKPWENWALYEERSAYRGVERVTTPLLIQVGERDERVPAEQSIQFYEAVKSIGKAPTKLVVYPGQPHGVRAPRLVRDLMSRNVEWLRRWLLSDSRVSGT